MAERMRRSVREIAVAIALTLAALVFVLSALRGPDNETASITAPEQGIVNTPN